MPKKEPVTLKPELKTSLSYPLTFWQKIKYIVTKPKDFFDVIQNETEIKRSIIYYLLINLIVAPLGIISFILLNPSIKANAFFIYLLSLIIGIVIFVLFLFLYNWIISLFGGKQGLTRTFQTFIYGSTPGILLSWVPFVNFLASIYSIYLTIIGLIKLQQMETKKAILAYFLPIVIFLILGMILVIFGTIAI